MYIICHYIYNIAVVEPAFKDSLESKSKCYRSFVFMV